MGLPMNGQIAGVFLFFGDFEKGFRNKGGAKKVLFCTENGRGNGSFRGAKIEIVPIFSQSSSLLALYSMRESASYGKS